jgi:carboxypeptidase Q
MVKLFWFAVVPLAFAAVPLNETYREPAQKLITAALADNGGYVKLSYLCDRIGNRISGSESLNHAIEWAAGEMKKDGLQNVVTPEVMVPHWIRGRERLTMVAPVERELVMLGLGDSVGTPKSGVTADVVAVSNFEELGRLGRAGVAGKIVLYNAPYVSYFETNRYRTQGPSRAAQLGAVAALVRSITPVSLQSPHTGQLSYSNDVPRIPAAAVTIEGALMIQRLIDSGSKVRVHLEMEAKMGPDAKSANVIGEIPGSERPDQVVVIGGHIDSWDVGQGAQDDGSGCVTAMQAAAIINRLGMKPRRTIRVVLWTNEENGGAGGRAYRKWVGDAIKNHFAAIEMDGGAEKPTGFGVSGDKLMAAAVEIGQLLTTVGASSILRGGGGADIDSLVKDGVPGLSLRTTGQHYFDWHHTNSDTVDKVNPADLRANIAAMAVMAYVLADMPE